MNFRWKVFFLGCALGVFIQPWQTPLRTGWALLDFLILLICGVMYFGSPFIVAYFLLRPKGGS